MRRLLFISFLFLPACQDMFEEVLTGLIHGTAEEFVADFSNSHISEEFLNCFEVEKRTDLTEDQKQAQLNSAEYKKIQSAYNKWVKAHSKFSKANPLTYKRALEKYIEALKEWEEARDQYLSASCS